MKLRAEIEDMGGMIAELEEVINEKDLVIEEMESECQQYEEILRQKDLEIKNISDSRALKISNPLGIETKIIIEQHHDDSYQDINEDLRQQHSPKYRKARENKKQRPYKFSMNDKKWSDVLGQAVNILKDNATNRSSSKKG